MTSEKFSEANKQLIDYKPFYKTAEKTTDVFDLEKSNFSKKIVNKNSVLLICDFEGTIVFIDETFSKHTCLNNLTEKSILDFLHQEDIPIVIEQLVHLLQEKSHSIVIDTRILTLENKNFYSKWHVGYLRGLFYFYPIDLPKFLENISNSNENSKPNFKSQKSILPDQLLWKIEVSKTLYEWDALIFKQIKSCTSL